MTTTEQIKALAELDGWTEVGSHKPLGFTFHCLSGKRDKDNYNFYPVKDYRGSYDAIIPLMQKQDSMVFIAFLCALLPDEEAFKELHTVAKARALYYATPSQLCEALLRATGKWK